MIDTFLKKLTQFEKSGSIHKFLISLENLVYQKLLVYQNSFSKQEVNHVIMTLEKIRAKKPYLKCEVIVRLPEKNLWLSALKNSTTTILKTRRSEL